MSRGIQPGYPEVSSLGILSCPAWVSRGVQLWYLGVSRGDPLGYPGVSSGVQPGYLEVSKHDPPGYPEVSRHVWACFDTSVQQRHLQVSGHLDT